MEIGAKRVKLGTMVHESRSFLSRRTLCAAPFLLTARHALAADADPDVVIVGAGAAGLSAAHAARAAGLRFVVVEARSRIGGRTVTDTRLGAPFDGGATFIHFSDKNPWTGIAERLGVETQEGGWRRGGYREFRDGQQLAAHAGDGLRQGRNKLWELAEDIDFTNDQSFARLVEQAPEEVRAAAYSMSRGAVGEEPDRVSVADYIRLYEGSNRIVPTGYGALVAAYGQDVPVALETVVSAIDWSGKGVRLATNKGEIRAKTAVITVPLGVLKAERIRFTPALPTETQRALDGLAMGALSKIALRFRDARFDAPPNMFFVDLPGRLPGMSFELWPFGSDLVVCWFGADYARQINALGEQGAVAHMLDRFAALVGEDARKAYAGGVHYGWSEEPFALGSYSYAKPGQARARDTLRRPVGNRLWFAGEACAGKASMTVGGAHETGEHAVKSIASMLRRAG